MLVGLGATSLSTSPAALPAVRATLREHSRDACEKAADAALAATGAEQARAAAAEALDRLRTPERPVAGPVEAAARA